MWKINNEGFVRVLQLDNMKEMNSINPVIIREFIAELDIAAEDPSVRVVVLTGTDAIFSSGMNVQCFLNAHTPPNQAMLKTDVPRMFDVLIDFPKPIIAAVNGVAVGWGATVCGLADMVFMAESAKVKCPFGSLGNVPEACSTYTFPLLMGRQQATWVLMSSEWLSSAECKDSGFALKIFADDELLDQAMKAAQKLASFPTVSLVESKRMMMDPYREDLKKANRDEMQTFRDLVKGPASQEGAKAFTEKREPDFSKF